MNTRKITDIQVFVVALLAMAFFLPVELTITKFFNNIIVSWLMIVLLIVWVQTAAYCGRNLRHFEGNDRWLLLVVAVSAPVIAFLIWRRLLGQYPDEG